MAFSRAAAVRGAASADCTNNAVAIRELKVRAAKSALMLLFHRASQGARAPYPSRTSCRSRRSRARYVYLGGEYGSGVPSLIGGYFFRLSKNSSTIFVAGAATHELCQTAPSRSSFRSVRRLMTFGSGRVTGGSYMFSCQIKCTFQFRHLTADNRSAT